MTRGFGADSSPLHPAQHEHGHFSSCRCRERNGIVSALVRLLLAYVTEQGAHGAPIGCGVSFLPWRHGKAMMPHPWQTSDAAGPPDGNRDLAASQRCVLPGLERGVFPVTGSGGLMGPPSPRGLLTSRPQAPSAGAGSRHQRQPDGRTNWGRPIDPHFPSAQTHRRGPKQQGADMHQKQKAKTRQSPQTLG
ncbi:hypothetical protein ACCO45_013116 [Purpureocillium lilacinum]|uniref:Uncharacterized protein n=1 Tax=Purpureocillium lilacinum TaxID=33203 RepID=A0ACC4DAM5_PURLI